MKIKDLEFTEQYLYEIPEGNYFRGVTVNLNGVGLLSMWLDEDREPITDIEIANNDFFPPKRATLTIMCDGVIPRTLYPIGRDITFLNRKRFLLSDLENAKLECIEVVKRYVSFFIK